VEPAESLDLLEDVEMFEVVDKFLDEEAVDGRVERIARELVFEIVEDQGDTRIWAGLGLPGSWVSSVVGKRGHVGLRGDQINNCRRAAATVVASTVGTLPAAAMSSDFRQT
jgi:hypothetical protein